MAEEVLMPRLSDTMDSGTIARWRKKEGDTVSRGDTLAEIETDKANMELEAFTNGVLAKIYVQEGQSAGLGEPIAVIAANAEEAKQLQSGSPQPAEAQAPARATEGNGRGTEQDLPSQNAPAAPQVGRTEPEERIKASPLARRMAQEHDLNLADIGGTGPGGRITKEDVQSYLKQMGQQPAPAAPSPAQAPARTPEAPRPAAPAPQPAPAGTVRAPQPVQMSRMQQTIARRMTEARFSKPEFVLTVEVDMTEAQALLQSIKAVEGAPRVGPNDLLIKAVAATLTQHPEVNAGWENDTIARYGQVNVGNAVAIPGGLVVPVIRDADKKSLGQISTESKELIRKAQEGKLAPTDYEGGTFTVSNLGMYGIEQFTPILNPPEACIIGVGAIEPKPVVVDGEVTVRQRMHLSMACDHRVINGAEGADFLRTLRRLLESPMLIVL